MFDPAAHAKLDAILSQLTELTTAQAAMLTGLDLMNTNLGSLREITSALLDSVTEESGGELAEEIAALVLAVNGVRTSVVALGKTIPAKFEQIVLANGGAIIP